MRRATDIVISDRILQAEMFARVVRGRSKNHNETSLGGIDTICYIFLTLGVDEHLDAGSDVN